MVNELNLFESLFADSNEDDCELEMINQMFQHVNFSELSKYYDISSYNNSFATTDSHILSVIHVNLRSIRANVDKMITMMHALKSHPDVIAVSKHWLTENNKDSFIINGYKPFHVIRSWDTRGGGISPLIRNNIQTELVSKFTYSNKDIEICTVTIKICDQKFNIVAVYRPSSKHKKVDKFTEIFLTILRDNFFANLITYYWETYKLIYLNTKPIKKREIILQSFNHLTIFQLLVDQHAFQWGIKGEMSRCLITFTLTSLYHPSQ